MSSPLNTGDNEEMITEINITPFVDVVLVLLILFMLAAPVVIKSGIKVELPTVKTVSPIKHVTLQFFITAEGKISLEEELMTLPKVEAAVKKALSLDPQVDVLISADKNLPHGKVLEIIDLLKENGIQEVALGIKNKRNNPTR